MEVILVGGFLGSGKTTALVRLAKGLAEQGRRVGIISNDQAENLVDTKTFRSAGFATEEVPGGCFCCKFEDLIDAAGRLSDGQPLDVILAEPVGSCTDIVATVIRPLQRLYADRFQVAPYVTLLDPERGWHALAGTGRKAFSSKVAYIFNLQQHEADVVAINKIDTLTPQRRAELLPLVCQNFPKSKVIEISARTGEGFDELLRAIGQPAAAGGNVIDVDYDIYAEGEAELGWLNASATLTSTADFDGDDFLMTLLTEVQNKLRNHPQEPAHVKVILSANTSVGIGSLIDSSRPPESTRRSEWHGRTAELVINARVPCDPDRLQALVFDALASVAQSHRLAYQINISQHFSPARPQPTHRLPN